MQLQARSIERIQLLVVRLDHSVCTIAEPRLLFERAAHLLNVDLAMGNISLCKHELIDTLPTKYDYLAPLRHRETANRLSLAELAIFDF